MPGVVPLLAYMSAVLRVIVVQPPLVASPVYDVDVDLAMDVWRSLPLALAVVWALLPGYFHRSKDWVYGGVGPLGRIHVAL